MLASLLFGLLLGMIFAFLFAMFGALTSMGIQDRVTDLALAVYFSLAALSLIVLPILSVLYQWPK